MTPENRLTTMLSVFGWQGGTIHQVNQEVSNVLHRPVDVLGCTEREFSEIIRLVKISISNREISEEYALREANERHRARSVW